MRNESRNNNQYHRNAKLVREWYEKLYANKIEQPGRNGQVLLTENCSLPSLSQDETDNFNRLFTGSDIETAVIILKETLQTNVQEQTASLGILPNMGGKEKNRYPSFSNYSKKIEEDRVLSNSSMMPPSP